MGARVVRRRCCECARPSVVAEAATVKFATLFTGRQPSQNGQCHFLFFLILALCHSVWVGVPLLTGHQPSQNGQRLLLFFCFSCFSPSSCLISRPSEKSRMRCLNKRGRESWDWAEQKSLYKKNSPHKVGEETFDRIGARWRK